MNDAKIKKLDFEKICGDHSVIGFYIPMRDTFSFKEPRRLRPAVLSEGQSVNGQSNLRLPQRTRFEKLHGDVKVSRGLAPSTIKNFDEMGMAMTCQIFLTHNAGKLLSLTGTFDHLRINQLKC